jgi:hypothetical protein
MERLTTLVCHACCGWGHVAYPPAKKLVCPVTEVVDICYFAANDKVAFNTAIGKPAKPKVERTEMTEDTWASKKFPKE